MKYLIVLSILFIVSCNYHIMQDETLIVVKKIYKKGDCNYQISVPLAMDIMLNNFSCDCFSVGDTVAFAQLKEYGENSNNTQHRQQRH